MISQSSLLLAKNKPQPSRLASSREAKHRPAPVIHSPIPEPVILLPVCEESHLLSTCALAMLHSPSQDRAPRQFTVRRPPLIWCKSRNFYSINIVGTVDLLNALRQVDVAPGFGAAWYIPTFLVPALFVTHFIRNFRFQLYLCAQSYASRPLVPSSHRHGRDGGESRLVLAVPMTLCFAKINPRKKRHWRHLTRYKMFAS